MQIEHFDLDQFIDLALKEDLSTGGDHTSKACVPASAKEKARLLVKADGILAGVEIAKRVFAKVDPDLEIEVLIEDGSEVKVGDIAFYVTGSARNILTAERLVLNLMQRMSGIATKTNQVMQLVKGTNVKVLDTRKTTPNLRYFEKMAVVLGGGTNHRYGLFDMIMIKDNHVDYAGGITEALDATHAYLKENSLSIKVEIETRNMAEVQKALDHGGADRIMLDNFSPEEIKEALEVIDGQVETEASGGITEATIRAYAETGVDYISMGALTHSVKSLDLSLKAVKI
ncbi:MAG: carboxylating nicotinate-nucleotide diphosphorylase [Flavobacteriales bacterium]|nr:carboxylating nicotinate-nucleotide diphosphorylase [Flavobacteriales bacterium]